MTSHTPGAFEDQRKTISSKQSRRTEKEKVVFQDTRVPRAKMAVQAHAALENDIQALFNFAKDHKVGAMKF